MWFRTCVLVLSVPGLLAIPPAIDEKYLQDIMVREGPKENLAIERVVLRKLDNLPKSASENKKAEIEIFLKSSEPIKKSLLIIYYPLPRKTLQMYKEVFPKMDELQAKSVFGVQKNLWPRVYDVEPYENGTRFIIENVLGEDWKPMQSQNKTGPESSQTPSDAPLMMDMEHCKLVMEKLADYHALSAVLKQKNAIDISPFDFAPTNMDKLADQYKWTFTKFAKSIQKAWGAEWENAAKYFETIGTEPLSNMWHRDDSKFNVLAFGPFHISDSLFKYATTDQQQHPIAVKFGEWTTPYWNSPIFDLQAFIYANAQFEIATNDARIEEILNHYAEVLVNHLTKYGYETPITKEYLSAEIRRTELHGLAVAINALQMHFPSKQDEQHTTAESNDPILNPTYVEAMKKLVARAQKSGLIPL